MIYSYQALEAARNKFTREISQSKDNDISLAKVISNPSSFSTRLSALD